jgi:ATP-binding cassette, subfamily B, heavy metal transporter
MRHGNFSEEPAGKINWRIVTALWPYLRLYKARALIAVAFLIASKAALLIIPFLLKAIVDGLDIKTGPSIVATLLTGLILAYGVARFSTVLFGEIRDTVFGRVTERAMRFLGLRVFRHLHQLDLDYHLNRGTGGLARDIERGTTGISFLMRFFIFNIGPTFFEIAMVIGILLINYGPIYAVITFASIAAYVTYSVIATEKRTKFVRETNAADSSSNTRAIDSLMNFETVKYFTNEEFEAQRYDQELNNLEVARRKNRLSVFALNGGQALIIAIAQTSMIGIAAFQVRAGNMSLGDFTLINAFMMQLFMPLGFLGFVYREIKGSLANIERLFDLLDRQPKIVDAIDAAELKTSQGSIEFNAVSFSYRPDRPILNDVSFSILPGEKVAVVGASGAGKSTLVKLLFRFYDTTGGTIRIDGQDISKATLESLRHSIGIVPQDTVLFNDTIYENVRYGRPDASDAEVDNAIRLAHLSGFITDLPQGSETRVGERGLKLSGGEKQRISIARTILKRPPILIFDEATSSLDSKSEQAILGALQEIAEEHTSLVIAHRLSTIIDADKIIVLDHGRIVEQGAHEELLVRNGHYADLWRAQQKHRPSATTITTKADSLTPEIDQSTD